MKNLGLISGLLLAVSFNANADLIIDDFNGAFGGVRSVDSTAASVNLSLGEGAGGHIIGGSRDIAVAKTSVAGDPPSPSPLGADLNIVSTGPVAGIMTYSNDALTTSVAGIQWDGVDNSTNLQMGLGGVNLLANFQNRFEVDVIQSDIGFLFAMTLYTDFDEFTRVVLAAAAFNTPATVTFGYELFAADKCTNANVECGGALGLDAVDLQNVNAMELTFLSSQPNIDLAIDEIRAVPAPTIMALLGLGLFSFGLVSRRKVRASLQA